MANRSCTNCGRSLAPDERFCAGCDKPVQEISQEVPEAEVLASPDPRESLERTAERVEAETRTSALKTTGSRPRGPRGGVGSLGEVAEVPGIRMFGGSAYADAMAAGVLYRVNRAANYSWGPAVIACQLERASRP